MSNYSFSINRFGDLLRVGVIVGIPMLLTILQNDTQVRASMLGASLFVLYREGLNKWLCIPILLIAALFIVSFLLTPMTLLVLLILICVASEAMMNGRSAFAHRLPRLAGALGHRSSRRSWDSSPPARWTSTAAC